MPEGPEVFAAAMCGAHYSESRQFCRVIYQRHRFNLADIAEDELTQYTSFGLEWHALGKQLHIRIISENALPFDLYVSLTTCGQIALVPNDFVNLDKVPLAFQASDMTLCIYHKQNKFMRVSKEVPDIGPSILHSKVRFEKNIKVLLRTEGAKWQRKPLCNVMLDQRWFNGVGNYIRSEVIYKSGFKPCDDAFEILSDKYKLKRLIDELHELMTDILSLCVPTFNPYDTIKREAFQDLIQCYGKMKCSYVGQRKIWYFPGECGPLEEEFCKPAADSKKEKVGPFAGWCVFLEQIWDHYGDIKWTDSELRAFGIKQPAHAPRILRTGSRGRPRLSRQNKRSIGSREADTRFDKKMREKVSEWNTTTNVSTVQEEDVAMDNLSNS